MEQTLKVTIIQSHLYWENPVANLEHFSEVIETINEKTDLIVLPEMFTTGFSMNAEELAEEINGPTLKWLQEKAIKKNIAITGSIIIKESAYYYNRLFFVFPDGTFKVYDKKHTFTLAGEHKVFTAGLTQNIIDYKGFKINPLICYDLRFPVWARNTQNYDLLLYVANWPEKRINAWDTLLKARAIENMSYCVGVNRTGLDGNGHQYTGHSAVYDVLGNLISTPDFEREFHQTVTLSKNHISTNRKHLNFLNDADSFTLI
ncbi:carbon-nitrogen hydrolase [Patiriisocius marinistellae]|uniref:Omega-amidase YafV n=1 Tax=Patiriisocius marinistellae TaxID=2494560 RepID=A0A5J4FT41_9FLAO|nr:amidohydrolase [Patiriisocius marinistellae]GEQ84670.1 carbon-nitrogen hydrolase [Patiriisocius marinistellae]